MICNKTSFKFEIEPVKKKEKERLLNKVMKTYIISIIFILLTVSCARLDHIQIGNIDNTHKKTTPFSIKVSEQGYNLGEARSIARFLKASKEGEEVLNIIAMFQMGPRTGNPVFVENYAENILDLIHKKCPSRKVKNLDVRREAVKYPVISGEIININGECIN